MVRTRILALLIAVVVAWIYARRMLDLLDRHHGQANGMFSGDECLAGKTGARGKDFNTRWIASMVAEAHRILMRGGVFLYPRDTKDPARPGRLRLLYEANPIGFIMEQAGARASTGREPMLTVAPSSLHQRIGLVFGSKNEVERIERYHSEPVPRELNNPLFAERSLFRD